MPEVALSAFPGDAGGLLPNINRWRKQIELAEMDEAQLKEAAEFVEKDGVKVALVDFAAGEGQRVLGAVIVPGDGQTWFLKSSGAAVSLGKIKPDFDALAKSFRVELTAAPAAPDGNQVRSRLEAWQLPSNWAADPKASSMVAAAYDAANSEGGGRVTVTLLTNDGGGLLANINRWRQQVGLPPVEKVEQQPLTDLGAGSVLVNLVSADGAKGMSAAIIGSREQTWFFKLTGSAKGIETERQQFERMVRVVGLGERAQ
jgi:hypothetical protein